jgi:hypothetical protein
MEADSSPIAKPLSFDQEDDRAAGFPAGALRQALEHIAECDGLIQRTNGIRQSRRLRGTLGRPVKSVAQLAQFRSRSVGIPTGALDIFQRRLDVLASRLELLPCGFEIAIRAFELCPRRLAFSTRAFGLRLRGVGPLTFSFGLLPDGVGLAAGGFNLLLTFVDSTLEIFDLPLTLLAGLVETTLEVFDLSGQFRALLIRVACRGFPELSDLTVRIAAHLGPGTVGRFSGNAGACLLSCLNQIIERRHVSAHYTA